MESSSNALIDFGRFVTGFLVVMGIGMFAYCEVGVAEMRRKRRHARCQDCRERNQADVCVVM